MSEQGHPVFKELILCMLRIALPPSSAEKSQMPAPVASAAAKMRLQDGYVFAHENTMKCIDSLARAYTLLVGVTSPFDSSPGPEAATLQPPYVTVSPPTSVESSTDYAKPMSLSAARRDESYMKTVFERHRDADGGLSKTALMAALREVEAPVLSTSEGNSEDDLLRLADGNLSGFVDLSECRKFARRNGGLIRFMIVAGLPDELEMFLSHYNLSVIAPALRAHVPSGCNQLSCLASLTAEQLDAATSASMSSMRDNLRKAHQQLCDINKAQDSMKEELNKEPGKYQICKMEVGSTEHFHAGLTYRIGSPNLDFEKAMKAEHCSMLGHDHKFYASNYKITSTPFHEWMYIVGDDKGQRLPCPDMGYGRRIVLIEEMLQKSLAKRAKLSRAEMIAVVLYTGPMFVVYNGILRQFPKELYSVFFKSDNMFSTTIFILVSAVQKISRCMNIPAGMLLYRGLGGTMELPDSFTNADENGCKGYTEFGFMSTTADRSVAVQYSGVKAKKPQASIMEIRPNAIDRGADISEFSQYPGEKEFLFVPMSYVQGEERCRVEIGPGGGVLKVISVRININLKTETSEQLKGKKKSMHDTAFKSLIDETVQWFHSMDGQMQARAATDKEYGKYGRDISRLISDTVEQMQKIKDEDAVLPDDDYVNDIKYKALVTRMLSSQAWAKQRLMLWLENQETNIRHISFTSLQPAHRNWLAFLKQRQHAVASAGSEARKTVAVKILQCKGLMVTDNASTEEADGEPLIYAAAADGWALDDLQLLIDAGASPAAINKSGDSALHAASENGDWLLVEALVKAGANVKQLNDADDAVENLFVCVNVNDRYHDDGSNTDDGVNSTDDEQHQHASHHV